VVAAALTIRTTLKRLDVSNCGFDMSGGTEFLSALSTNNNVLEVKMDRNKLSSQFPKPLHMLFFKNKTLSHVSMAGCKIGSIGGFHIS
jgi:hypothetical protein